MVGVCVYDGTDIDGDLYAPQGSVLGMSTTYMPLAVKSFRIRTKSNKSVHY